MLNRSFTGHPDSVEGLDLSGFSDFSFVLWNFPTAQHVYVGEQGPRSNLPVGEELVGRQESLHSKEVSKRRRGKVIAAGYSPSNLPLTKKTERIQTRTSNQHVIIDNLQDVMPLG